MKKAVSRLLTCGLLFGLALQLLGPPSSHSKASSVSSGSGLPYSAEWRITGPTGGDVRALVVDPEDPSAAPDPLEVEPGHDEREIDVEAGAVRGADERLARDHPFREQAVPRSIERLGSAHEIETERFAGAPGGERLVGVGRQKNVTILGDEQRRGRPGIIVRAREPDHHEADTVAAQPLDQARECVHQAQRETRA